MKKHIRKRVSKKQILLNRNMSRRDLQIEQLESRLLLAGNPLYRINAGGPQVTGTPVWEADTAASPSPLSNANSGGNSGTGSTTATIDISHESIPVGTPMTLFQTERFDKPGTPNLLWDFPVAAGDYEVRLYFAETWSGAFSAGVRVFDVQIEGVTVLNDYDIYADAEILTGTGSLTGVVKSFIVTSDANLDIDFLRVVQNPLIKGIEILTVDQVQTSALNPSATAFDFGDVTVGQTAIEQLTLTNGGQVGDSDITIDPNQASVSPGGSPFAYIFEQSTPIVLAPGESTIVTLTYTPTISSSHSAELGILHDGINSPLNIDLSGLGSYRVNAGGPQLAGTPVWTADTSSNPAPYSNASSGGNSSTFSTTATIDMSHSSIPNGTPMALFQTERWDEPDNPEMLWDFAVSPGNYEVRLYFAEIYNGAFAVGAREFDVQIEGVTVLDDYDVFADAESLTGSGSFTGIVKSFIVTSDANLDIDFFHEVENPAIKGIEILSVGTGQVDVLNASATSLDFGSVVVGTPSQMVLTLTNGGQAGDPDITIDPNQASVTPGGSPFGLNFPQSTPIVLAPGQNTNVTVTYTPTGETTSNATLSIPHSGTNTPISVSLSGSGVTSQPINFTRSTLAGAVMSNPTKLQFGPDGRLYVTQQNGLIRIYDIVQNGQNDYQVVAAEQLSIIRNIPNHNDDGTLNPGVTNRQVTGLLVTGTAQNPVMYVSSSDHRIGGGNSGDDLGLDTNSGIVSRVTWNGSSWEKLDLVRGLPRSEENHAVNGLELDEATNTLYLVVGGNTNMGAPSNNFAYLAEYAYAAAILTIDLDAIGETTYDLPTLDDEDRPGVNDANDPFGGNNGKNQAILDPNGPVQIYATGFRNAYDLIINSQGRMYTVDNGPNSGWGGIPIGEGPEGNATNDPNEPGTTYGDNLHYVTGLGYYGGHPNPTRSNPNNTFNASNPQSPVALVGGNPIESDFQAPGIDDPSLAIFGDSTNGIDEYTLNTFGGQMQGDLIIASFDNTVKRVKLNAAGDAVVLNETLFTNIGIRPLDVEVADTGPFAGTIWVADIGFSTITIFEPSSGGGGTPDDLDGDGYSNDDEIANGTNPNNASSVPPDWDGDFVSNLSDPDDDNDSLLDDEDPFAIDASNGQNTPVGTLYTWDNDAPDAEQLLGLGFTGLMTNGVDDYETLFDPHAVTAGGAAGVFTLDSATAGTALGTTNTQEQAFQFGVNVAGETEPFVATTSVLGPFAGLTPQAGQEMGLFIGTGDQDNYVKIVLSGDSGGSVKVVEEIAGSPNTVASDNLVLPGPGEVQLFLSIDPVSELLQASYIVDGGARIDIGSPIAIAGSWVAGSLAVGVISTDPTGSGLLPASWNYLGVVPESTSGAVVYRVNAGGPQLSESPVWEADTTTSPSPYSNASSGGNSATATTGSVIDMSHPSIPAGTPIEVFQSERFDKVGGLNLLWDFPVAPGDYEVRLYFSENWSGAFADGVRKLDVQIEGVTVLDDYDVFADVGSLAGVVKSFTVTSDSNLDIDFLRVAQNPSIKGIEILTVGTSQASVLNTSAASLDFGSVVVGDSSELVLTLSNGGQVGDPDITIDPNQASVAPGGSPFTFSFEQSIPIVLPPGESTDVTVTYTPISETSSNATLSIPHSGTNTPISVSLSGSGVTQSPEEAVAKLEIYTGGSIDNGSTAAAGSFRIYNNSTGGKQIDSVTIDLSTSFIPDVVYDPNGAAGDPAGIDFTPNSGVTETGQSGHNFSGLHDGGFDVLQIDFTDFDPGEVFTFRVDVDPTSVQGAPQPGPADSASISGLELSGATVTVHFSDNTTLVGEPFALPEGAAFYKVHAEVVLTEDALSPAPSISLVGVTTPAIVTSAAQTLRVTAPVGSAVRLLQTEVALHLAGVPGGGFDIDPYEANKVVEVRDDTAVVGAVGFVDIPVTLSDTLTEGGINYFVAVIDEPDGRTSDLSNVVKVALNDLPPGSNTGTGNEGPVTSNIVATPNATTEGPVAITASVVDSTDTVVAAEYFIDSVGAAGTGNMMTATDGTFDSMTESVSGTISAASFDALSVGGHTVFVRGQDALGNWGTVASTTLQKQSAESSILYRVNVGGPQQSTEPVWESDTTANPSPYSNSATGNSSTNVMTDTVTFSASVPLDTPMAVFQSNRADAAGGSELEWEFLVTPGDYEVRLYFVEAWSGAFSVGTRKFDVAIEGAIVLDDYDVFAAAGALTGIVETIQLTNTDGILDIDFLHVTRAPIISGIEIIATGAGGAASLLATLPQVALPGDYDGNGLVDRSDREVWKQSFGSKGDGLAADGNGDGLVNAADFTIWRDHEGLSLPSGGTRVASRLIAEASDPTIVELDLAFALLESSPLHESELEFGGL